MHTPTILLLLSAVIGLSSGTIYWKNGPSRHADNRKDAAEKAQTQINLVLEAFEAKNVELLYELIPFGTEIDHFLKNRAAIHKPFSVQVKEADELRGTIVAAVRIHETINGVPKNERALISFEENPLSPTGYKIRHGFFCKEKCMIKMGYFDK
ncbi:unnamed protein product [Caenorhabditis brenneri]